MAVDCSTPNCSEPGTQACSACKTARYCSKACQKAHWKTHKRNCIGVQKDNCFVIRAAPASEAVHVLNNIPAQIEPLHLQHCGNEQAEKRELQDALGWGCAAEVGKFYDHSGTDVWYYYVYGDVSPLRASPSRPRNEISDLICYEGVYGDIAVVRSGPGSSVYSPSITHSELCKAVEFYKTEDRARIFLQREKSRFLRNEGINPRNMPPHVYLNSAVPGRVNVCR